METPIATLVPPDGGIMYAETNMDRLIPEPLNTITSGCFLIIAVYWLIRLHGFSLKSVFLSIATYVLLIGSIGGTAYHGLRLYPFFIMMDWVPIVILCMLGCYYFWAKVLKKWLNAGALIFLFFLLQFFIRGYMEQHDHLDWGINVNYGLMALMVVTPLIIYLFKTRFSNSSLVFVAIGCFALALFFRVSDGWRLLPVGTHFLWHTLGAVATQMIFLYIYKIENIQGGFEQSRYFSISISQTDPS